MLKDENMEPKINKRLKKAIIDTGMSQRDVSKLAGVKEWNLSLIARGRLNPTVDEQRRIARVLGVRPTDIFDR